MATAIDLPPTYDQAIHSQPFTASTLPPEHNGIPPRARRSMEDELRPLPERWVRTYDPNTQHQFFVDTVSDHLRATWNHPYDDEEYLSTLSPSERDRIRNLNSDTTNETMAAESGTDGEEVETNTNNKPNPATPEPPQPDRASPTSASSPRQTLGRKLKDALTGTTHAQRSASRAKLQREEREMYRQHQILRKGMKDAMNSGTSQFLGQDEHGTNVYLEPPGHMFPGVDTGRVKPLSPYLNEVFYEGGGYPDPEGRYLRPGGEMYGYGYGGYDCGVFGGGRWRIPEGECCRGGGRQGGGGFKGGMALPLMAKGFAGVGVGSLMF